MTPAEMRHRITELEAQVEELEQALQDATWDADNRRAEVEHFEARVAELRAENAELEAENEEQSEYIKGVDEALTLADNEIRRLEPLAEIGEVAVRMYESDLMRPPSDEPRLSLLTTLGYKLQPLFEDYLEEQKR